MEFFESVWASFYQNVIYEGRWLQLLKGMGVTLEISLISIMFSTVIGTVMAFFKMSRIWLLRAIATTYINIIRGTPVVTQLLLIYFGIFGSVDISKIAVAIFAFSINSGAYVAEIIRAGINAVDAGQMEAGRSLGLNKMQTMAKIILPQAIKKILPTYTNEFIVLIKETAIVGYIAIEDLTKVGDIIRSRTFDAFMPYIIVALMYFCVTYVLTKVFGALERRLAKSDRG